MSEKFNEINIDEEEILKKRLKKKGPKPKTPSQEKLSHLETERKLEKNVKSLKELVSLLEKAKKKNPSNPDYTKIKKLFDPENS